MNGIAQAVSYFLGSCVENAGDQRRHAIPLLRLGLKLTPPGSRQPVELRLALVVGFAPLTGDQALVEIPCRSAGNANE